MSPLIPLAILVGGAGALLLGLLPNFSGTWLIALLSAVAALVTLLAAVFSLPAEAMLSSWGPASLLPVTLRVQIDPLAWLLAVCVLALTLATLLTGIARPGGRRIVVRGATLLLAATGLTAIFSANLVTRIVAWAGLDLIYFLALVLLARSEGIEPQAVLNLAFNSAGTLLAVGAALLISRTSDTLSLREAALAPASTLLITLAAVFRLGLFPLHLGLPAEANIRQGLGAMLRLVPAAVALETVGRLAAFGFASPVRAWLTLFGVAAALVGAVQLWNTDDPRLGLTYVVIAQSGLALLAGMWSGVAALAGQSAALVLGGALIFLTYGSESQSRWSVVLPLLGAAGLLGLPLTPGFVGVQGLLLSLLQTGNWLALAGVIIAQVILAAGLIRAALWPGEPSAVEPLPALLYWIGASLLVGALLLFGQFGGVINTALGAAAVSGSEALSTRWFLALGLVLLAPLAGFGLWRAEAIVRGRSAGASALLALVRLDWLYRLVWGAIHLGGVAVRNLAEVLEGEGALLWAVVAALLVWLLVR